MIPLSTTCCKTLLFLTFAAVPVAADEETETPVPTAADLPALDARVRGLILESRSVSGRSGGDDPLAEAEVAMGSWWTDDAIPPEALMLRATLKQAKHDFRGALEDLGTLVSARPDDALAWLTKSTVHLVVGEYGEAGSAAARLDGIAPPLVAATARAGVDRISGDPEQAAAAISRALVTDRRSARDPSTRNWALTLKAEIEAQLGRAAEAEKTFQSALLALPGHRYTLSSYAWFLLDEGRTHDAIDLLEGVSGGEPGLMTILAIAEKRRQPARSAPFHEELESAPPHGADLVFYQCEILGDPAQARLSALLNWRLQKEPRDAKALLEAALASGDPWAAADVLDWVEATGFRHAKIDALVARVESAMEE